MQKFCSLICLSFVVLSIQLTIVQGSAPPSGKYYIIQNVEDESYLKVAYGAILCERIGGVTTFPEVDRDSPAFRWKYDGPPSYQTLEIDSTSDYLQLNEVTMYSRKPYCYHVMNDVEVTEVSPGLYSVMKKVDSQCLASNGSGQRISWIACNPSSPSQRWKFIEA